MVSRGFSHAAASLLVLAMGSSAFLPAKLMSTTTPTTGVAAPTRTTSAIEKLESCDDLMKRHPGKVRNTYRVLSLSFVCDGIVLQLALRSLTTSRLFPLHYVIINTNHNNNSQFVLSHVDGIISLLSSSPKPW